MQYDSFGNLLQVRGDVVRLPIGFAGGLFDADTGLTRFVWRDYDADTGRFTALDPMGEKGGTRTGTAIAWMTRSTGWTCGGWRIRGGTALGARLSKAG